MKESLESFPKKEEYPFRNSLLALTLDAEIKRIALEREEAVGDTIKKLAKLSGVHERQIYNYRSGKSQIPDDKILIFCKQFRSVALSVAWLQVEAAMDELEELDLVQLANRTCQQVLGAHSAFLEAFDDGKIDGFELTNLKTKRAAAFAGVNRLMEIAEADYQRRQFI